MSSLINWPLCFCFQAGPGTCPGYEEECACIVNLGRRGFADPLAVLHEGVTLFSVE